MHLLIHIYQSCQFMYLLSPSPSQPGKEPNCSPSSSSIPVPRNVAENLPEFRRV